MINSREFQWTDLALRIAPEGAFKVLARAQELERQGKEIVHMEVGEPDFDTPSNIVDAAVRAMKRGVTHYTPASGLWGPRDYTARYVSRRTGVSGIDGHNVVIAPGSKAILLFTLLALVQSGDEVIVPDPAYPVYRSVVRFADATPVPIRLRQDNDFRIDIDELEKIITPKTKVLIINSPANPTGGVMTKSDAEAIAALAIERDLFVLTDEIYSRLIYDGEYVSIYSEPGMPERTVLMDGLSKAWAMCGWRLGWGVMPVPLAKKMDTLMMNTNTCAAAFTQLAAIEAFESPESDRAVDAMVAEFRKRRQAIIEGLNNIEGVTCKMPPGAFYAFPDISATGWDAGALAHELLEQGGVAVLAGSAFGEYGAGHLRLSYASSLENIGLALERMQTFLQTTAPVPA